MLLLASACAGRRPRAAVEPPELVGVWYTVRVGDSVSAIASRFSVAVDDIVELNGMENPDQLKEGQALFLFGIDELVRRLPEGPAVGGKPRFIWPLAQGVLSSGYGPRSGRKHQGIDIAAAPGTVVKAVADGTVVYSDNKQRGYGNLVIIRHDGGYVSVYAHNRRNLVDEGQRVRQGAPVAEVGSTGRSTGPHLHFEIRQGGVAIDPLVHLPAR